MDAMVHTNGVRLKPFCFHKKHTLRDDYKLPARPSLTRLSVVPSCPSLVLFEAAFLGHEKSPFSQRR
jgi:hypothetical protein